MKIENSLRILRNTETAGQTDADPLAMPAGGVEEPTFPVLAEGIKRMLVKGFEQAESKEPNKKTGKHTRMLVIKLQTTKDELDMEGKKVHAGFPLTVRIMLDTSDNRTNTDIAAECAMSVKAILGAKTQTTARQCIENPTLVLDKPVDVKVTISKGKDGYPDSNTVRATNWIIPNAG